MKFKGNARIGVWSISTIDYRQVADIILEYTCTFTAAPVFIELGMLYTSLDRDCVTITFQDFQGFYKFCYTDYVQWKLESTNPTALEILNKVFTEYRK